jgi:hypothetical protein
MRCSTRGRTGTTAALVAGLAAAALAGCGLAVQAPDLFVVTRTGQGKPLTMLVNYDGTLTCNGHPGRNLPDKLMLAARALPGQLQADARKKLDPPSPANSIYRFKVSLQYGTFSFPDTSAKHRPELAMLLQVVLQAEGNCSSAG